MKRAETPSSILEGISRARREAIKNGIMANAVIIDNSFVKTREYVCSFGIDTCVSFPPTICGLKVAFADLPGEVAFCVLEATDSFQSDIERLVAENKRLKEKLETVRRLCRDD